MVRGLVKVGVLVAALGVAGAARADAPDPSTKDRARSLYIEGVQHRDKIQWSDALAAFEASAKLYPVPATTLAIGSCERALGRYVRARMTLSRALAESAASSNPLPESSVVEAKGFVAEIDRLLAHATLTITPVEAEIAVDGRPLAVVDAAARPPALAAGVEAPGAGAPVQASTIDVVLDPGAHVFTLTRRGFAPAVVPRSFLPGSRSTLEFKLDLLPATLKVTSTEAGAIVRVNDADVGPAPVDVLRPAGSYRVVVGHDGFVPYDTRVTVRPGEEIKLSAALIPEKASLFTRWWFWTGAAAVVAGGVVLTYALTRPDPTPPDFISGSTGWLVHPTAAPPPRRGSGARGGFVTGFRF